MREKRIYLFTFFVILVLLVLVASTQCNVANIPKDSEEAVENTTESSPVMPKTATNTNAENTSANTDKWSMEEKENEEDKNEDTETTNGVTDSEIGGFTEKSKEETESITEIAEEETQNSKPVFQVEEMNVSARLTTVASLRSGPGTTYDILGTKDAGDELIITGKVAGTSWYETTYETMTAYIHGSLLTFEEPEKETVDETDEQNSETQASKTADVSPADSIIQAKGNISSDFLARANAILNLVPLALREAFLAEGWHYYVSEADVGKTYAPGFGTSLKGLTIVEEKVIYLDYRGSALDTPLHEFGHFIDWYYNWPSEQDEFAAITKAEGALFSNAFSYRLSSPSTNTSELFAEAFDRYCSENDKLKENCPKLYTYFLTLLEK